MKQVVLLKKLKRLELMMIKIVLSFLLNLMVLQQVVTLVINLVFIENLNLTQENIRKKLIFTEKNKTFNPKKVYGNAPNPTKL